MVITSDDFLFINCNPAGLFLCGTKYFHSKCYDPDWFYDTSYILHIDTNLFEIREECDEGPQFLQIRIFYREVFFCLQIKDCGHLHKSRKSVGNLWNSKELLVVVGIANPTHTI